MCAPQAMAAAATIIAASGQIIGGLSANAQGKYAKRVHDMNAGIATEAARDSIVRGQREARQFYREVGQTKGAQNAAMAANGIDLGFGSALRTQEDTAMLAQEDSENLYSGIFERTRGFEIEGINHKAAGKAARYKGKQELIGSLFKATSTLMGGASQGSKSKTGG